MDKPDIRTLHLAGQQVRVALHGRPDAGRTLLVFNGIGASLETVAPFAAAFRDTCVVTFDVPGVGGSPTPALPYRFSGLARLAARLLDTLGIAEVDVFGVSWGGALAQQFVHDHPDRCRSLTLAATCAGFVMAPGDPRVLARIATPRRYADPAYMLEVGPDIYGGRLRHDPALLAEHAGALRAVGRRGYLYQLLAGVGWTSWHWLPGLRLPALVLMGADDPIVPTVNGRILASRLPDARLEIIPCGHLFILTDPAGTAARIENFIHGDRPAPRPARALPTLTPRTNS
ncbi:MAG TPA: poly(3-hydroxyalkanoate) depolymerase [Amaricoccus sp.]|nr:poly(3-hydroxyalkanoate) depolymerase [Amaricoccus sp.]